MKEDEPRQDQGLPDIPDYPEAPLPAWKHYGITNYASNRIVQELDSVQYEGHMVGLELAYVLEDEKNYTMSFGKIDVRDQVDVVDESSKEQSSEPKLPLSEEFLADLYGALSQLMAVNAPGYLGKLSPELTIVMTGSYVTIKTVCRVPQRCTKGHANKRWCYSVNSGPWTCLHGTCS